MSADRHAIFNRSHTPRPSGVSRAFSYTPLDRHRNGDRTANRPSPGRRTPPMTTQLVPADPVEQGTGERVGPESIRSDFQVEHPYCAHQ